MCKRECRSFIYMYVFCIGFDVIDFISKFLKINMKAEEMRIGNYVKIDTGIGKAVSLMSNTFAMNVLMTITT